MNAGTLFSGIGAPECSAPGIDWRWCAEIDPFASAVHAARFPDILNLGDVMEINADAIEPVDLVVFGSPCQSFSVAGKRLGLEDPRGNLALVALCLVERLRPRWFVFENVPGLLSSDGGRDFGAFLGTVEQCGYGWAYRTLDAQFAGVPQRRRRVFVVGCLGDWRAAAAVLFEPESLRGNTAPRREAGQRVAPSLTVGAHGKDHGGDAGDIALTLRAGTHHKSHANAGVMPAVVGALQSGGTPNGHGTAGINRQAVNAGHIIACVHGFDASEDGTGRGTPLTLAIRGRGDSHDLEYRDDGIANAILTPNGGRAGIGVGAIASAMSVRRLTPRECERLQGFPDDWTLIRLSRAQQRAVDAEMAAYYRRTQPELSDEIIRKLAKDGPRYRALGNSMAVPVIGWILRRLGEFEGSV